MNLTILLKNLKLLMSYLIILGIVTSCSTLNLKIKPSLVEYQGSRYWIIIDDDVKELARKFCVEENINIINGIVNSSSTQAIDFETCYNELKEGSVFYKTEDINKLDAYIKAIGQQYHGL